MLTCSAEPPRPTLRTDADVGRLIVDLAHAGADCRDKLGAVRDLLAAERDACR